MIISSNEHNLIKISSRFTFLSILLSCYYQHWDFFIMSVSIYFTSIKYWDNPKPGFWKNIDIINVQFWLCYCFFISFNCKYQFTYLCFIFAGIISFLCNQIAYYFNYPWVIFHVGVHLFSNIGNVYLFSGI